MKLCFFFFRLNQSVIFEEFLNLKPVEKKIGISDSQTFSDEFTKIKEVSFIFVFNAFQKIPNLESGFN